MENNEKRKRPRNAKKKRVTNTGATGGARPQNAQSRTTRTEPPRKPPARTKVRTAQKLGPLSELGITLNSETARQAIILSEIIGKPVSKRKRK